MKFTYFYCSCILFQYRDIDIAHEARKTCYSISIFCSQYLVYFLESGTFLIEFDLRSTLVYRNQVDESIIMKLFKLYDSLSVTSTASFSLVTYSTRCPPTCSRTAAVSEVDNN